MAVNEDRRNAHSPYPLYMLAFDHRQVLRDLYPDARTDELEATKGVVLDALQLLSDDVPSESLAFLVDEEYGREAALTARERGHYVAMPIEASRTKILQMQFPDDYQERFSRYDPQAVKTLVFHNPADDAERKRAQLDTLRVMGDFAREQGRDYLLEILMKPSAEQLAASGGDLAEFRATRFADLLIESIAEMQAHGIDPDIWKIEGLETVEQTAAVAAQATTGGRDHVRCIVLGSGESQEKVQSWLANASAVPAFSGFAIGRTVWHEPLGDLLAGRITREEASERMARTFGGLIAAFGREPSLLA